VRVPFPGVDGATVAARCFPPDRHSADLLPDPIWVFATHGSGADWRYWHIDVPGEPNGGYSFADVFTRRGVGVVAIDILGVGDSTFPADGTLLSLEALARAHAYAVDHVRTAVADGSLIPRMAPVSGARWCGVGHSGGAGVTIVQQATHASFDLIAPLGMPADDFEVLGGHDGVLSEMVINGRGMLEGSRVPRSEAFSRSRARAHLDDVPEHVITAREPQPFPQSFPSMMRRGTLLPYAQRIACPVFLGFGEVDYAGSPFEEPSRYASAGDITVCIQPGSAHQHNTSTGRHELWNTLFNWIWGRTRFRDGRRPDTAPRVP